MKNFNLNIILFSSIFLLMVSSCKNKSEPENTKNQAEQLEKAGSSKVIFENDYAKVSKISLAPGDYLAKHEGANRVIYSLTDYTLDWEEKGENLGTKTWKKGEVHFHEAGEHAARNNGTTLAEWIVFSRKNTDLPDCNEITTENDVNSVSPEITQVLFENDFFKVTEVNLPFLEKIPPHSGINRIVYSITGYDLKYKSDKEEEVEKHLMAGDVHWHEACNHTLENTGEVDARFLIVNYKQIKE